MKKISILGSTGSIGTQTLSVVRQHPDLFRVEAIAANCNDELLEAQINEFKPQLAVLYDEAAAKRLQKRYSGKTKIMAADAGLIIAATLPEIDTVVTSLMGFAGLRPTLAAIEAGKNIALANKETLVVAGELVMAKAQEKNVAILPVDSEHCAIFQCLQGNEREKIEKLLLTASGGPFRGQKTADLLNAGVADCLAHPTWSMGQKITIDSASLVNKGLEIIEAHWLYNMPYEKIQVVVHPQSILHSMVEYIDGTVMAQLGSTDMRLPIQYALTYPERINLQAKKLDFWNMPNLTFEKPDTQTFRGIDLAYNAGKIGGTMPCVLNAANEIAVDAFLHNKIKFLDIYNIIEEAMQSHQVDYAPTAETFFAVDEETRFFAKNLIK
ncbi:1-deoxy-D-xylulose-5-phosphate reductoisomerase [Pectinatus brassicae]|uniref:1-deoxy-D-xylulose 5-phosphate reductoisomerase n=1 Tax=Pectinatus brassicae TaxID=862415 RepID=A0A840USR4_9FIRM|nr:1-deoxy-D-xylulose-5-phosphate reductoisomerase [Pectinatus brassicae]MBB5337182.1 1-deoxy-D-xylulose-5-phosphate reductoisomerase [Pectinatus brassicae]